MGCAGSKQKDLYEDLVEQYGRDKMVKLAVSISKVQFIESSKPQMIKMFQNKFNVIKFQVLEIIDNQKDQIDKKYFAVLNRIQKVDPNATKKAEKIHGQKLQKLMGYQDSLDNVTKYKEICRVNIQRQQSLAVNQITHILNQFQQQLKNQIPSMKKYKKYDKLDDQDQQKVIKKIKKKNKEAIQKAISQTQNQIYQKLKIDRFQPKIRSYVTNQRLKQLQNYAQRCFFGGQQKVKGANQCRTC